MIVKRFHDLRSALNELEDAQHSYAAWFAEEETSRICVRKTHQGEAFEYIPTDELKSYITREIVAHLQGRISAARKEVEIAYKKLEAK